MSGFNYSWPQNRRINVTNKRKRKIKRKEVEILEEISEQDDQINEDVEGQNLTNSTVNGGTNEKTNYAMSENDVKTFLENIREEVDYEKKFGKNKQNSGYTERNLVVGGDFLPFNESLSLTEEGDEQSHQIAYTELDYYDAACLIQNLYYIKKANARVKLRKVERIEEQEEKLNRYHAKYLLDLMVVRIQKNVRRMLVQRAYFERMSTRYYKEISYGPTQYYYYAVKLQAWYRGTRMRHKYAKIKPDLLKDRYRRSICSNCHTKASVKRCLLCRGDFCFNCFQIIHKPTKGRGHNWIYSESFVRKQDAQVKALAAVTNQYIELDKKYKMNPIHYDGAINTYAETPPPTADEYYIYDDNFEGSFLENSISTVSMSEWNASMDNILDSSLSMSMSFRGSTAIAESDGLDKKRSKKYKKKVQFGENQFSAIAKSNEMNDSLDAKGLDGFNSLVEFGSFDEFQNSASVIKDIENTQHLTLLEQAMETLEVEEYIADELVTNNPFDSMTTFPLIIDRLPKPPKITYQDTSEGGPLPSTTEEVVEELMPGQFFQTFDTFFKKTTIQDKIVSKVNGNKSSSDDPFEIKNKKEKDITTQQPKSNTTTLTPLAAASNFYGNAKKPHRSSKIGSSAVQPVLSLSSVAKSNNKTVLSPLKTATDDNGTIAEKTKNKNKKTEKSAIIEQAISSVAEASPIAQAVESNLKAVFVKSTTEQQVQKKEYSADKKGKPTLHIEVKHSAFDLSSQSSASTSSEWTEHLDDASGYPYYYNNVTGESSWTKPV